MTRPCYVRWCRKFSDIDRIVVGLQSFGRSQDLDDQIRRQCLHIHEVDEGSHELSVYRAESRSLNELGHAMAVVAVAVGQDLYRPVEPSGEKRSLKSKHRKEIRARTGATVLLDEARAEQKLTVEHRPETCTTIYPAATFHYDIVFGAEEAVGLSEVVDFFADELVTERAVCSVKPIADHEKNEQPFEGFARKVLEYTCEEPFLLAEAPNDAWKETNWEPSDQVARLRRLAAAIGFEISS